MENLEEKWEKSEKTRGRGSDPRGDEGKRKGLRWRCAQISACHPLPLSVLRGLQTGAGMEGLWEAHASPPSPSVWSLARQGLVNPSPGRRRHRAEFLGPRLAQRQCS